VPIFKLGFEIRTLQAMRCAGVVGLSLLFFAALRAQQGPTAPPQTAPPTLVDPTQPTPTLSITTREVLLDVVVTDASHHPMTGLKASDFTVIEESAPQRITSLDEHHAMSAEDLARIKASPALPPNTFTNFTPVVNTNASTVILLDALNTRVGAQMSLRQELISYLKRMQPGTPIAIFQLDTEMRLIQGFSSDPQVLLAAAQSKRDMPSLREPIRGSKDEYYRAKNAILHEGLDMMGRYLAAYPGRKNLIWFTGQLPSWLSGDATVTDVERRVGNPFKDDFSVFDDSATGFTDALTLSRVAVYPIDARELMTDPRFSAESGRPGGGTGFGAALAMNQMNLDAIAEATGGKAYYNTNRLDQVIAEIVNNGSNYYSIAYSTSNQNWNGGFRHIKLAVNRPGLKLQYRPGYYAVDRTKQEQRQLASLQKKIARSGRTPYGQDNAGAASPAEGTDSSGAVVHKGKGGFDASMALGAVPPTEIIFTASLSMDDKVVKLDKKTPLPKDNYLLPSYKDKPFRTYNVHIQTDAHTVHVTKTTDGVRHGAVQFVTAVYDQQGQMVNSLDTTASFDLSDAHYRKMLSDGLPAQQQIAVPVKGNYFLRIGIHDLGDDHVGAVEIPVDEVHPGVSGQAALTR
jgi:VWFA-related protein